MMRIGFIGLGKMGLPMSHHLLQAGFSLTVHNRSRGAVDELVSAGAKAEENSVRLLAGSLAQQIFAEASEQGLGAQDMSALVQPLEKLAGVQMGKRG